MPESALISAKKKPPTFLTDEKKLISVIQLPRRGKRLKWKYKIKAKSSNSSKDHHRALRVTNVRDCSVPDLASWATSGSKIVKAPEKQNSETSGDDGEMQSEFGVYVKLRSDLYGLWRERLGMWPESQVCRIYKYFESGQWMRTGTQGDGTYKMFGGR